MSACVLDTDAVIAALDARDDHHDDAVAGIESLIASGSPLLLSLVNYAEALVRPAHAERTLRTAVDAIAALGMTLIPPTPAIARRAAQFRNLNVSLADGFAMATASAHNSTVATFDRRVRRALPVAGLSLPPRLR